MLRSRREEEGRSPESQETKSSSRLFLFLAGAGVGGLAGAYLVLRKNREKIDRAARTTRQVADQAERVATALEQVSRVLGTPEGESRHPEEEPVDEISQKGDQKPR
ncbi:MAG: hypothetical protein Q8W44_13450 [Candidatus Palauibacterales bacterium]|nr:hypothetical protein [Candidatus Palauibacterales bacterium]